MGGCGGGGRCCRRPMNERAVLLTLNEELSRDLRTLGQPGLLVARAAEMTV